MREIQLTAGKLVKVDDQDFSWLSAHVWHAVRADQERENWYARRHEVTPEGKTLNVYMHRAILGLDGADEADHKDRDGLNNQRYNLRKCTRMLNCANIVYGRPASGYRGVYRHREGEWRAQATVNSKTVNLGLFRDPAEAAKVRDAFVLGLYGDFAVLNFPAETS